MTEEHLLQKTANLTHAMEVSNETLRRLALIGFIVFFVTICFLMDWLGHAEPEQTMSVDEKVCFGLGFGVAAIFIGAALIGAAQKQQ